MGISWGLNGGHGFDRLYFMLRALFIIFIFTGTALAGDVEDFLPDVGEFFGAPLKTLNALSEKLPPDEVPVLLHIAKEAGVAPQRVLDLRLAGKTWADIVSFLKLSPAIFHVDVEGPVGPPYGRALGYYRNKPRKEWGKIVLPDADIVNLVNLKFLSLHFGLPPGEVINLRAKGKGFPAIAKEVRGRKAGKAIKGKVKGKGKGRGK